VSATVPGGLGRRVQFDERSRNFPSRALPALGAARSPRSYTWRVGTWLDQGREGACVGYGFAHELAARPVVVPGVTNEVARAIYHDAQRLDPWDGGAYEGAEPYYEGTSVLAGARALTRLGHYSEYRWAFGEEDLALAVGYHGPAVIGVDWYEGMYDATREGGFLLRPTGRVVGGHCVLIYGLNLRGGYYRVWNSWGRSWGDDGTARITREDMVRLLADDGEACVPVRRARRAAVTSQ